ncbi:MAG: hypothetical protein A2293_14405 [Elusimicrobia bacterium RIFOXYB2_FULL_49_7]|nr:MAG: hypothetical protein A2293_14405 [Elusimicrobia bacterium RIFOXYB2_FULL_49_7]
MNLVSVSLLCVTLVFLLLEVMTGKPRVRILSALAERFVFLPFLIYLVIQAIQNDHAFPILLFLGAFVLTCKEVMVVFHDIGFLLGYGGFEAISTRRFNRFFLALATVMMALHIRPWDNLAMLAALMMSVADGFGLLWKYFIRKRGIKNLNLAIRITLVRLLMSPAFLIVYFYDRNSNFGDNSFILQCTAIFFAIMFLVTDGLDGYFARKRNEVTKFGKYFDPFSDKICTLTIFLCFVASNYVPVWMVALIYYREASISVLRTLAAAENIVIAARPSGKWKTGLQGTAILTILVLATVLSELGRSVFPAIYPDIYADLLLVWDYVPFVLMTFVTIVTVISGIDYFLASRVILDKYFK